MSPLVEQMLESTLELVELEDLFSRDCACASDHIGIAPCTKRVVARKTVECAGLDFLICRASYKWNLYVMADPERVCAGCNRDSDECWTIRPV